MDILRFDGYYIISKSFYHIGKVEPSSFEYGPVSHPNNPRFRVKVHDSARALAVASRLHPHIGLLQRGIGQLQRELGQKSKVSTLSASPEASSSA